MKRTLVTSILLLIFTVMTSAAEPFKIEIIRETIRGGLVYGKIYVNKEYIGDAFENDEFKITTGQYKGVMRYHSGRNFVQNPFGELSRQGDFLLEVSGVPGRTNILFHAGNRPQHSTGCILLGPANRGPNGAVSIGDDHPLRKLRLLFYGTDEPISSPDKDITITVVDPTTITITNEISNLDVTLKEDDNLFTFKPKQVEKWTYTAPSTVIEVWECPTNQSCKWVPFTLYVGYEYSIVPNGNGTGPMLRKN